jgi:2-dehydropantoate 2-reductase
MKFAIIGAGAMGSLFGGRLAEAGHQVQLVDIDTAHIGQVRRYGLRLETHDAPMRLITGLEAMLPEEAVSRGQSPECLILFTKTIHSRDALAAVQKLIGTNTVGLSLQNGLGNLEVLRSYLPAERCVIGVTSWPATLVEPGSVKSTGAGTIELMSTCVQDRAMLDALVRSLCEARLDCARTDTAWTAIWEKLAFNTAINSVCAATGLPAGGLNAIPEGFELVQRIVDEVLTVAVAGGTKVDGERCRAKVLAALIEHPWVVPSTLEDLRKGRATEINSINGAVVKEARRYGIAVPYTQTLLTLVRLLEVGQPRMTVHGSRDGSVSARS